MTNLTNKTMNAAFELIDKELIASLNFPKSDVLEDKEDISLNPII